MVPKHFLPAHPQMLPIKEKRRIRDGHLTNITNKHPGKERQCTPPNKYGFKICEKLTHETALEQWTYRIYSRISRTFLPGIWLVFCLRLIRATYPEGQSFLSAIALTEQKMTFSGQMFATSPLTQMKKMKMTPTTIYRIYRRTSHFRRRRFLMF